MIRNLVEEHVREAYQGIKKRFPEFCGCDLCREDVLVFALNRVPPRYVTSHKGKAVSEVNLDKEQNRAVIDVALIEGIRRVTESPRHAPAGGSA